MRSLAQFSTTATPQLQPMPFKEQVQNNAGGYVFAVDDWTRLDRFLILGTEGGTYYVSESKLTLDNAGGVLRCLKADGSRTVRRIVELSVSGRAPKNDPALFALALAASHGDLTTRREALAALPRVARTGTHLFTFAQMVEGMRGWGRGLRRAVGAWYSGKSPDALAHQLTKYVTRGGWSHRDTLRLADAGAPTPAHEALYRWAVTSGSQLDEREVTRGAKSAVATKRYRAVDPRALPALTHDYEAIKRAETLAEVLAVIGRNKDVTWEMVPDRFLGDPRLWEALLAQLPMTALLRNLARMTANGLIAPMSNAARLAADRICDMQTLRRARVHPVLVLKELCEYRAGHRSKGNLTWEPVAQVIDALDEAFYLAFGNVEASGKRILKALDVSGSMSCGEIAGVPGLTPRVGTAALAMVSARVERQHSIVAFCHRMVPIDISPRERLDDVVRKIDRADFGGTDCALPMLHALERKLEVDLFEVYTDNETWAGHMHPPQALERYRRKTGIAAKLAVIGMTATGFSIADPNDAGMLDVVGFDTATPELIRDFACS